MNSIKIVTLFLSLVLCINLTNAQETDSSAPASSVPFESGKKYTLGDISVVGAQQFSEQSVKVYSGLKPGQEIKIPGDKLSSAIKKLYGTKRFSSVEVFISKIDGNTAYLEFKVQELPQISSITITGIKKSKAKDLREEADINKGDMLTDNLMVTTKNYAKKKFTDKGYLKTKVSLHTKRDTTEGNAMDLLIRVDRGKKIKIKEITFDGNKDISDAQLRSFLKDTKRKFWGRFWKTSKYVKEKYKADLQNLLDEYSELGYRDARIISDSIVWNEDGKTINLEIKLEEGKRYYFGDISFLGNSNYTTEQLQRFLRIEKGDVYDSKLLEERVKGDGSPDSEDISSLYQNSGYLFSQVNAVETKVENNEISVEVRIHEDDPATIRKVSVKGNEVTNDFVIYRELRTKPGDLYSKENIIRSIREISQLGFFDPENVTPDLKPNYADKTVDIEYSVVKKGSSQIELQGGYGGGSFIGTLGLSFNNFSIRNLFNGKEYKPLPMGDGQALALRLQVSRYYSTSSFSFTEPWLGGKKPKSFSFSIYNSRQYQVDFTSNNVDKSRRLNIFGVTVGLGQRLTWPDDYFTLSQAISFKQYDINQYNIGLLNFEDGTGVSNNLSYSITLGRNSSGPSRIFPTTGSDFSISAKFTLPHSLFSKTDFASLEENPDYQEPAYGPNGEYLGMVPVQGRINEAKFKWLEYYKLGFKSKWYTKLIGKSVLMTQIEFGYLGYYNEDLRDIPFERYFVGGDGLQQNQFDGREIVGLRGYENSSLSGINGGTIYNKFTLEARYPITLKPSASIYVLGFVETGNSYQNFQTFNPFDVRRAAGVGVRIFMPAFGLLGIDFANGFDPIPGRIQPSGWQTHFIIGQQF
ncbi:outer membrane protein assembly factor BamA [Flavicella marina]|uniref:outer membrane protein assembly factor BamA n=1 Tax=Flavicella marina TaxID=1475951 RepID=UPI0012656431|nr:outer membrane protein assembly factor BamA [Flavicella marina]